MLGATSRRSREQKEAVFVDTGLDKAVGSGHAAICSVSATVAIKARISAAGTGVTAGRPQFFFCLCFLMFLYIIPHHILSDELVLTTSAKHCVDKAKFLFCFLYFFGHELQ